MRALFLFSCIFLAFCAKTNAASLSFKSDATTLNPGATFEVDMLVEFNSSDLPASAQDSPIMKVNIVWPEGVSIYETPIWNYDQFYFSDIFFEQSSTSSFLWATAKPNLFTVSADEKISIAKLKCQIIDEIDDESFYYETWDMYSYPTSILNVDDEDILGDPDDDEDGIDELPLHSPDMANYSLSITPESDSIPFSEDPLKFDFSLAKSCSKPAEYDHIRIVMSYDSDVLTAITDSLTNALPPFFENVEWGLLTGTNAGIAYELGTYLEADCSPTNYIGLIASLDMKINNVEEDLDIEFEIGDPENDTVLTRINADLLGLIYEDDDGIENTIISIRSTDTLRISLLPEADVLLVNSQSFAKVVLLKNKNFSVEYDYLCLEIDFNSNLFDMSTFDFAINPSLFGTNLNLIAKISSNLYSSQDFNSTLSLEFNFLQHQFFTNNFLELGTLNFTPVEAGQIIFDSAESLVEFDFSEIQDLTYQDAVFPVSITALTKEEESSQFIFNLNCPASNPLGSIFELNILAVGPITTNANGCVIWLYDADSLTYIDDGSAIIQTGSVVHLSGTTSDYFSVNLETFSSENLTTLVSSVTFKSIAAGSTEFIPAFSDFTLTNSYFLLNDNDILGSRLKANDGVSGATIIAEEPTSLSVYLEPIESLYAGRQGTLGLFISNPENFPWNQISFSVLFDPDEIMNPDIWQISTDNNFAISQNVVELFYDISETTNKYGCLLTNIYTRASFSCISNAPITNSIQVATLKIIPMISEPYYIIEYDDSPNSKSTLCNNDIALLDSDSYSENDWIVNPSGIYIWLEGNDDESPVLGTNYLLNAFISNPNNYEINAARVCWGFDSTMLKVNGFSAASGFVSSNILINSYNDGDGYITADFHSNQIFTNSIIKLASFYILPNVSETIEIYPDEDLLWDGPYTTMDVQGPGNFNYLETLDEWAVDICPIWRRNVLWFDIPQLIFDDLWIEPNENYILDLYSGGEGLVNYKTNATYLWSYDTSPYISIDFNLQNGTAVVKPLLNWSGKAQITIYCQELGSPHIASCGFQVVVGDEWEKPLDLIVERDEYLTATDYMFEDLSFKLVNATSNTVVTAMISLSSSSQIALTNFSEIILTPFDDETNEIDGYLRWATPAERGYFLCVITAKSYDHDGAFVAQDTEYVYIEIAKALVDPDGDLLLVIYNNKLLDVDSRAIEIKNGDDSDTLVLKTLKGQPSRELLVPDGLFNIDSIKSDHGFKKISHRGSVNYIETDGPIGSLTVKGGFVGEVVVKRGALKKMKISHVWDAFDEASCIKGVSVEGDIGNIIIIGGGIGTDSEPAIIESINGSIRNIKTKLLRRRVDGYIETSAYEGANIYASILATNGSIGKIMVNGGSLGTAIDDAYCLVYAKDGINSIFTKATTGDYEILGGFIHSDIKTDGKINTIKAFGGDICGSPDTDFELDDFDYLIEYPVTIKAESIKSIEALAKVHAYSDGDPDFREWELRGGNLSLSLDLSGNVDKIDAKGGNICASLSKVRNLKSIRASDISYRLDPESNIIKIGGNMVDSIVAPNSKYMSSNPLDYNGVIGSLNIENNIYNSWIGLKGPVNPKKLSYGNLIDSQIWSDGKVFDQD